MDDSVINEVEFDLDALRRRAEMEDGSFFPASSYAQIVLAPAYDEAKENLLVYMHAVNKAHLVMLYEEGILSSEDASAIKKALVGLPLAQLRTGAYTGKYEDLFFEVEDLLIQAAGSAAGNLHIARSRNDMGVALYRLALRDRILGLIRTAVSFQTVLAVFAKAHVETFMIAHTHTQQAQPTTLGHYIAGAVFALGRDIRRLCSAFGCVNRSPMGAAAITTSGFPVNRERMRQLLGFDEIIENSYDCIAGGDYLGETATAVHLACINLSRLVCDLLLWSTQEFGYLKVAAPYIQVSSIMPQKQNPVSIEHARSMLSSASGDCAGILTMLHNTPYGDIVDTEDDAQPALWRAIAKLEGIYRLMSSVIATVQVDEDKMEKRVSESYAVITELADTLVRKEKISFRQAHGVAHELVTRCLKDSVAFSSVDMNLITDVFRTVIGRTMSARLETIMVSLDYKHFINIRRVKGGPEKNELMQTLGGFAVTQINGNIQWEKAKSERIKESMEALERGFSSIPSP